MFSPTEQISLVFTNKDDLYFGDDLLKLTLNQYLWKELHKTYQAVYFLSATGKSFTVQTFGDAECVPYTPKHSLFSSEQSKFSGWLLRQLRESAAFVCSLEDFCSVLGQSQWKDTLQSIAREKKRCGSFILTASTADEATGKLLLESPVFQWLQEDSITVIRGGTIRSLYESLLKNKWKSCFFLNAFTQERIHSLLLHIVMEHPDRCCNPQSLNQLAEYLTAYLRDPKLHISQPIFPRSLPIHYLLYRDLYEQLKNEKIWSLLTRLSTGGSKLNSRLSSHDWEDADIPILRDPGCYAGKCLLLRLPKWLLVDEADAAQAEQTLCKIQRQAAFPRNRPENPAIIATIERFLQRLEIVRYGDTGSYLQILEALEFCMNWLYCEEESQILSIIKQMEDTVTICEQCYQLSFNLQLQQPQGQNLLHTKSTNQLRENLNVCLELRNRSIDLTKASIIGLSMSTVDAQITQQVEQLQEKIQQFGAQLPDTAPIPEAQAEPEEEEEDLSEFVLTAEDYDIRPSVSW